MKNFEKLLLIVILFSILVGTYIAIDIFFTVQESEAQIQNLINNSRTTYFKSQELISGMEKYGGFKEFNERVNNAILVWAAGFAEDEEAFLDYFTIINNEFKDIIKFIFTIIFVHVLMMVYLLIQLKKPNKANSHGKI